MVNFKVADESLAEKGKESLYVAENKMPVIGKMIRERFEKEKPLKGIKIAGCLHVTKETAILARTLKAGGADVLLCGSNPLSTQDDVAAALVKEGISVFAWHGNSDEEFYWCIRECLKEKPNILIDDGADMIISRTHYLWNDYRMPRRDYHRCKKISSNGQCRRFKSTIVPRQ